MSDRVDSDKIEEIVGTYRRIYAHVARCVDDEQKVYLLHPHNCKDRYDDLRDCEYSLAMDNGVDRDLFGDGPTMVSVVGSKLVPTRLLTEHPE